MKITTSIVLAIIIAGATILKESIDNSQEDKF